MLPKLLPRHSNLRETVRYLFAVGGRTVHTDPHIVAAWDDDLLHPDVARPNDQGAEREIVLREIITQLDAPRRLRRKTVAAGHVLHVPISAHHDDGQLGDERWRELAEEFVARLELDRCRWIAVHHGTSKAGNDHVHLVVQLVDEDGRVARLSHSKVKARAWAIEVEQRLGLLRTGATGTGARELTRAEHERAQRTGIEPQRRTLERQVRAAAAGSTGPGEFVDVLANVGVRVDPVIGDGPDGQVTGYRVALEQDRVRDGGPALRLSGGKLARDLALPELIDRWHRAREALGRSGALSALSQAAVTREVTNPAAWTAATTTPVRMGALWWAEARRELSTAAGLLDRLNLHDPVARHIALEQAAQFTAVLALRWPTHLADERARRADKAVRAAADELGAATRLWNPAPTRRPPRTRPLLPALVKLTIRLARSSDAELVLALLVLTALAALVIALSQHLAGEETPSPRRGGPEAHLRSAAACLRPYDRTTTGTSIGSATTQSNLAEEVVDEATRRVKASQERLTRHTVPHADTHRRPGRVH